MVQIIVSFDYSFVCLGYELVINHECLAIAGLIIPNTPLTEITYSYIYSFSESSNLIHDIIGDFWLPVDLSYWFCISCVSWNLLKHSSFTSNIETDGMGLQMRFAAALSSLQHCLQMKWTERITNGLTSKNLTDKKDELSHY